MRCLPLITCGLLACVPPQEDEWAPEASWAVDEVEHWDVLAEGLDEPSGLVWWDEAWFIAERGGGRIIRIQDGEVTLFASELSGPWGLVALEDSLIVTERDAGNVLAFDRAGSSSVLIAGLSAPTELISTEDGVYLLDEDDGALWKTSSPTALVDGLEKPTSLAWSDGLIYITESGSPDRVSTYSVSDDTLQTYAANADVPYGVAVSDAGVFFTGRSTRWPYAGWIYGGEVGTTKELCESPPGVERIVVDSDSIVWNTYESILRCSTSGGAYEMIAPETAVGSLTVSEEMVTWTDRQRGAVYQRAATGTD
jgi:glucose/arabinose dehydrogenase